MDVSKGIWRFPKSWQYPHIIQFLGFSVNKNHPMAYNYMGLSENILLPAPRLVYHHGFRSKTMQFGVQLSWDTPFDREKAKAPAKTQKDQVRWIRKSVGDGSGTLRKSSDIMGT